MDIQWYPGHMTKARRKIAEKIKIIDMIVEVVDARAPRSTINPDFADMYRGKAVVTVLNKSDLADPDATNAWVAKLKASDRFALPFSTIKSDPNAILELIDRAAEPICQRYAAKGVNKTIRAMIAGIPNVGKSAILNKLAGRKSAVVGNKPGVTRGLQWITISEHLELMDTPGMLYPKINDEATALRIAILGSINEEILDTETIAFKLIEILRDIAPTALADRFGIELEGETLEVYERIARRRGFLLKGGECDYERCARMLIDEFRTGKLGRITLERP